MGVLHIFKAMEGAHLDRALFRSAQRPPAAGTPRTADPSREDRDSAAPAVRPAAVERQATRPTA